MHMFPDSIRFGSLKLVPASYAAAAKILILMAVLGGSGCLRQGEILDPADSNNLPSLGTFQGKAKEDIKDIDPAFLPRFPEMSNPKVALVWQFIGPKEFTYDATDGVVKEANIPFNFTMDLRNPPGKEILSSPDLSLASFWLYQDGNGNGKMDCLIHPTLLKKNLEIDSLYAIYVDAVDMLLEVSEIKAKRVPVNETYFVGKHGTTVRKVGDRLDTIWTGDEKGIGGFAEPWAYILNNRFRILTHNNRWERYFALRKRANDYFRIARPAEGFAMAYEFPYERKLFPLPGKEEEFEKRVRDATWKLGYFTLAYVAMLTEAFTHKWTDYPYDNGKEDCPDWVAGRSRQHALLYFQDRAALDELLAAERSSSFSVTGKEKLHLGYNLVRCGVNYDCEVLDPGADALIDLGTTEDYFNPPDVPIVKPVQKREEVPLASAWLKRLPGAYNYQPFHPFCLTVEQGNLWVSIPEQGYFRLLPADSLHYFTPAADLQIQVVGTSDRPEKLLLYSGNKRFVAVFDSSLAIPDAIGARLRALAARTRIAPSRERLQSLEGSFYFGKDTLKVLAPVAESLYVSLPGSLPHFFHAQSESVFFSPYSDRQITFRRNERGLVSDIEIMLGDSSVLAPSLSYSPRTPEALFPGIAADPDSEVSVSGGSHRDVYIGVDGKGHYQGSPDGLFVGAGDGSVEALDRGLPGDAISLVNGSGGVLFKLTGMAGRSAGLDATLRRDLRAGAGRARFRMRGGPGPEQLKDVLCDDFWAVFTADSARIQAGAWPVVSDPYYVRLERVRTPDAAAAVAVDGYRLLISRGENAQP
jgi:hypothetical protein